MIPITHLTEGQLFPGKTWPGRPDHPHHTQLSRAIRGADSLGTDTLSVCCQSEKSRTNSKKSTLVGPLIGETNILGRDRDREFKLLKTYYEKL